MAAPSSPTQGSPPQPRRRASTSASIAQSVANVSQSAANFTENLILRSDPPLGFFAATASATSKAPTVGEIRRGSFGQDGWQTSGRGSGSGSRTTTWSSVQGQSTGSKERSGLEGSGPGMVEPFAPLTEEPTSMNTHIHRSVNQQPATETAKSNAKGFQSEEKHESEIRISEPTPTTSAEQQRTDHDRIHPISKDQRIYSSGYVPPPKLPWTTSTWTGLKAFWKWFLTPFGFCLTIYGLHVVAWGGMLFLLLCNASPYMCHAPVPSAENKKHMSPVAALSLPGPYYFNCNDINSPRRIWIEIDSQILNALFCVTGFGLVPWRFRDLYYLLRWRLPSEKSYGRERKIYGLRVLAGIHRGWLRLPGSETLDAVSAQEYVTSLQKTEKTGASNSPPDLEAALSTLPENDPRIPLPISKKPDDPPTSVRAPPTKLWKLDFFIWCQVWNTFFQCCLCGFMWGMNRYARPPWSTGLFVALACIIAGVGGIVSFIEGKHVKKVEGVPPKEGEGADGAADRVKIELQQVRTGGTGHRSIDVDDARAKGII